MVDTPSPSGTPKGAREYMHNKTLLLGVRLAEVLP